jgi:hypothetical protein
MVVSSMTEAAVAVMKSCPKGHQFHGNELHDDVALLFPDARRMYTDTLMRMMRRHCSAQYKTVGQTKRSRRTE